MTHFRLFFSATGPSHQMQPLRSGTAGRGLQIPRKELARVDRPFVRIQVKNFHVLRFNFVEITGPAAHFLKSSGQALSGGATGKKFLQMGFANA